ncbi:MAG: hypothetical protein WCA01_09715 [Burkholderiales bacterium]
MAEPEDDKVAERYRALGREEPPPELDVRILDAARRAAQSRSGRRGWMLPASIAAVIVLSVGVALQVQRERSDVTDQPATPAEAGKASVPAAPAAAESVSPPAPASAPSASGGVVRAPALERKLQELPARPAAQPGRLSRQSVEASPEQWLTQIAELRREGRDDEADRQLSEFRRRFPDYRIPQPMRRQIEPR